MICHIIDTRGFIQLGFQIITICLVLHDELNLGEISLAVGEHLSQFQTIGVDLGGIFQSVVGILRGTLPGQHNLVGVSVVAVDHIGAAADGGSVSNPQGAVGVAGIDHGAFSVHSLGGVDFLQTVSSHFNGHLGFPGVRRAVGDSELTVCFRPLGNGIGAGGIREELQNHIIFIVGDAFAQGIGKGVGGQVG